jgi:hypothetical protein
LQPAGCIDINLGYQPVTPTTEMRALSRLSDEVRNHPANRYFEIRWVDSAFFGWDTDHQWWLDYDRQTKQLLEAAGPDLGNDPEQDWRDVKDEMLPNIARHGFDDKYLQTTGCHSALD